MTNGGYSNAKALGLVKASAKSYGYSNDDSKVLSAYSGSTKQALTVTGSGTSSLGYNVTSGYDNELMRITLLTVKIVADSDASKGEYVLHVPIVVRRMLEVDFAATFVNGTAFSDSSYRGSDGNYLGANAHVLESYGNSMTGLLTYIYNSAHEKPLSTAGIHIWLMADPWARPRRNSSLRLRVETAETTPWGRS